MALAVAGLAASPLTAHAATPPQWVNGCGTSDYILIDPADGYKQVFVDGTAASPIKWGPYVGGLRAVDMSGFAGSLYDTNVSSLTNHYVIKNAYLQKADGTKTTVSAALAQGAHVSNTECTVTVSDTAVDLVPADETELAGQVVAPTADAADTSPGGTVTVTKTAGIQWTINDGGNITILKSSEMGATQDVDVANSSVTVTAAAETPGVRLILPADFTWKFTLTALVNTDTTPTVAPTYDAATNSIDLIAAAPATGHWSWYVTDASVTTAAAAAKTTRLDDAADVYKLLASDAGKTKRVWAIAMPGYKFSDGKTEKHWDFPIPVGAGIKIDPTAFVYTDKTGVSNDTVKAPVTPGVTYYYKFAQPGNAPTAPTPNPDGTLSTNSDGFKLLPQGVNVSVASHVDGDVMYVFATVNDGSYSLGYTPGLVAESDFDTALESTDFPRTAAALVSPAYSTGDVVSVDYPSFNDAAGSVDDSVTFPVPNSQVEWTVYAYPAGTATAAQADYALKADSVSAVMGTTVKRADFGKLAFENSVTDGGASRAYVNSSWDVTFRFAPTALAGSLPAGLNTSQLAGTLYTTGGASILEPVWIDTPGATALEFVKVTTQPNVTYLYSVDTDSNGVWDQVDQSLPTPNRDGVATIAAPAGSRVKVQATSTTTVRNADPGSGGKVVTFTHQFNTDDAAAVVPAAPTQSDKNGTADDTYTLSPQQGVSWEVDGVAISDGDLGKPLSTNGKETVSVVAVAKPGYALADGATSSWTLTFDTTEDALGDVAVGNEITSDSPPTAKFSWSADGATSYTVTYYKVLGPNQFGPEIPWLTNVTQTSANFVAMAGDEYIIKVTAKDANGETKSASSGVEFPGDEGLDDIYTGIGTFNPAWQMLNNLQATQNLPYFKDTAALGYTNADWTVTLPEGTKSMDLYATVHAAGAAGKIQVNGQNWADFTTNSSYWGQVSDPYKYPVRTIQGWDSSKPVTVKVIATDAGVKYLALDAYKAHN